MNELRVVCLDLTPAFRKGACVTMRLPHAPSRTPPSLPVPRDWHGACVYCTSLLTHAVFLVDVHRCCAYGASGCCMPGVAPYGNGQYGYPPSCIPRFCLAACLHCRQAHTDTSVAYGTIYCVDSHRCCTDGAGGWCTARRTALQQRPVRLPRQLCNTSTAPCTRLPSSRARVPRGTSSSSSRRRAATACRVRVIRHPRAAQWTLQHIPAAFV
jgi:hypothetical protein